MYFGLLIVWYCIRVTDHYEIDDHPNWALIPEKCGEAIDTQFRIYGGQDARLGQYPWLVRLKVKGGYFTDFNCGAALISKRHVITAAHCGDDVDMISVRIGEYDTNAEVDCDDFVCAPKYQDIEVEAFIQHLGWSTITLRNDIALVKLKQDAIFSAFVQPLCLPGRGGYFQSYTPEEDVELAGWGISDKVKGQRPSTASILQFVRLAVQNMSYCRNFFNNSDWDFSDEQQLCVGQPNGEDTCQGDSGGPVMKELKVQQDYRFYILGVVSYGTDCGIGPAIYTNVRYYLKWILDNL